MHGRHILIVDDEPKIREVLQRYLEREGCRVSTVGDGPQALEALGADPPDLVVLDLMLPGLDGLEVFRRLRRRSRVPVIMLTAKGEEADRVLGLELGADDYVVKPFSPREVVARVRSALRRAPPGGATAVDQALAFAGLRIDPLRREVRVDGQPVRLTAREFEILHFLARHPRQVFTRDQLLQSVWGYDYFGDASTVTVHIRRIREKIEPDPAQPRFVQTVWGAGYKFAASPE